MSAHKVILLKGDPQRKEYTAEIAVDPGMLVKLRSTGQIGPHPGSSPASRPVLIADVNNYIGKTVDDAYAVGERVPCIVGQPGVELAMYLADTQNVIIGDMLIQTPNGELAKNNGTNDPPALFRSLEALNNTSGARALIKVEVA